MTTAEELEASSTVAQHEVGSLPIFMCENHIYQHATTTSSTLLRSTFLFLIQVFFPSLSICRVTRASSYTCSTSSPVCNCPNALDFSKCTFILPVSFFRLQGLSHATFVFMYGWVLLCTRFLEPPRTGTSSFLTLAPHFITRLEVT